MKLRKLEWYEYPQKKTNIKSLLEPISLEIDKLKKKRPEFVGGSGATGTYHKVEVPEMFFAPSSFNPGINIIGVASGVPTTIWLPSRLDQNHLIAIKDELGISAAQPITVRVRTT